MLWYYVALIFITSCLILSWLSSRLVKNLINIAKYLNWREFIIAFFVMAFAASLPNLFVDLNAALNNMPELAFGDIMGGNLVDLTVVMAVAVLFCRTNIKANSKMVQMSAIFSVVIAVMPMLLVLDGRLDRIDGALLIILFFIYSFWLFSNEDRFKKVYSHNSKKPIENFAGFIKSLFGIIFLLVLLLLASQAVVSSAKYFSEKLNISLSLVGILIVGLGNCFPEAYFSIVSARRSQNWMVLGDLMGSIIVCATLVLGLIALVAPFEISDFSPFFIARIFLIIASLLFLLFIRTGKKITKKEGLVLLLVYVAFLLTEIFFSA